LSARLEGSAREEWRLHWTVVLAACSGAAMSAISSYSTSLFFEPLEQEYGWSRVEITSVHLFGAAGAILLGPIVGHAIDRLGARRVGIAAIFALCTAFSMLGLTGPSIWTWRALWVLLALVSVLFQPMVWSSAVASFFSAGRGFALAVTLCGTSICSVITPPLTVYLIDQFGWRLAFPALVGCWAVVVLPLVLLFFTSAKDKERNSASGSQMPHAHPSFLASFRGEALTPKFAQLAAAGFSIAIVVVSVALTIVPILSSSGIARGTAAGIASLLGLASIAGRMTIGLLLDRFSGRHIAAVAVCMPVIGSLVLLAVPGSVPAAAVAVVIFGLALGAELDILAYLTSRYFKVASFGMLFATIGGFVALAGAIGPVLLNAVYDATRSYELALWGVVPVCLLSATLFLLLGPYPEEGREPDRALAA
jgi:MFS family permease